MYIVASSNWSYKIDDFDEYKNDFQIVADFAKDYFESEDFDMDEDYKICYLVPKYDKISSSYYFWSSADEEIELPDDVEKSLYTLDTEAFKDKDARMDHIRYNEGRITFCTNNGQYAVVYSFDDKKPAFVNVPDENNKIGVKKIEKH